ncbi:hypothetical protein Taro_017405 [Colocasia esculenta]|uniref:Abscisic acid receptor PYL4 n=1 Tax=Colocasia esculenta TaxID=4460 RepID=A0A843UN11_COLES|nr:hypothetical protein [Colocasia esculenta]
MPPSSKNSLRSTLPPPPPSPSLYISSPHFNLMTLRPLTSLTHHAASLLSPTSPLSLVFSGTLHARPQLQSALWPNPLEDRRGNQCYSAVVQAVAAPVSTIWSVVRRFDNPQAYKHFVKSCHVLVGDDSSFGTLREVRVVSGLPAATNMERLEALDEESYILSFRIVGGKHCLTNYRSVTTLHGDSGPSRAKSSIVVESYVVDVLPGNTKDDTRIFIDAIVSNHLGTAAVDPSGSGHELVLSYDVLSPVGIDVSHNVLQGKIPDGLIGLGGGARIPQPVSQLLGGGDPGGKLAEDGQPEGVGPVAQLIVGAGHATGGAVHTSTHQMRQVSLASMPWQLKEMRILGADCIGDQI